MQSRTHTQLYVSISPLSSSIWHLVFSAASVPHCRTRRVDLPAVGSAFAEGSYSLFTKPIAAVQTVTAFTLFAKSGATLRVQLLETPVGKANFVDIRKVLPHAMLLTVL